MRDESTDGGEGSWACVVLVLGSHPGELLDELLSDLEANRSWQRDRSATIVWQVERGGAPAFSREFPGADDTREFLTAAKRHGFRQLTDGVQLQPGARYFVARSHSVWFDGRWARVAPSSWNESRPLDRLLLSLAETWGNRSVSLVALPADEDGECGLRIIRAVGGVAHWRSPLPRPKSVPSPAGAHAVTARASRAPRRVFSLPADRRGAARDACKAAADSARQRGRVRVWLPRCKTGGVTYALAMLLSEEASESESPLQLSIFGTDDDDDALSVARVGRYPAGAALGMDPELRGRYTFDEGDMIRVSEKVREVCIFSRHRMLSDPPMARMDLVVCDGLFDAVEPSRRGELLDAIYQALRHGGVLLALDRADLFPATRFEVLGNGFLRARPASSNGLSQRDLVRPAHHCEPAAGAAERAVSSAAPEPNGAVLAADPSALDAVGLPLLLCDGQLRLALVNREAQRVFRLSPEDVGSALPSVAPRLPGGSELVQAAQRVSAEQATLELIIRSAACTFLARISSAEGRLGPGVVLTFTDVTQIEAQSRMLALEQSEASLREAAAVTSDL